MLGVSTYAYFWRGSPGNPRMLTLPEMIDDAASLGVGLLQICDHPFLDSASPHELEGLRRRSAEAGVALEIGTRGVGRGHLRRYLRIAERLDASLVRSMVKPAVTSPDSAAVRLREVMPEFERAGVHLSLETYEQLQVDELVGIVEQVGHPMLGITVDPGNCVAALEHPCTVVEKAAPYANSVHVKDFAFSRNEGWVGFIYSGARLGEGLLDYTHLLDVVQPEQRGINQVLEHWLPWQSGSETTDAVEREWTLHGVDYMRRKNDHQ